MHSINHSMSILGLALILCSCQTSSNDVSTVHRKTSTTKPVAAQSHAIEKTKGVHIRDAEPATDDRTAYKEFYARKRSNGPIQIQLRSISKRRDGKVVQIVATLENIGDQTVRLTMHPDEPPVLLDNIGSQLDLRLLSGVTMDEPRGQIWSWTQFNPGEQYPLLFIFESEQAMGDVLSLSSIFLIKGKNPYSPERIPLGFVGLRMR